MGTQLNLAALGQVSAADALANANAEMTAIIKDAGYSVS